jgi:hypothetical protein
MYKSGFMYKMNLNHLHAQIVAAQLVFWNGLFIELTNRMGATYIVSGTKLCWEQIVSAGILKS